MVGEGALPHKVGAVPKYPTPSEWEASSKFTSPTRLRFLSDVQCINRRSLPSAFLARKELPTRNWESINSIYRIALGNQHFSSGVNRKAETGWKWNIRL